MDLTGKVALVTGGGSGIGAAIAEALLEKGARVAIADLSEAHMAEVNARVGGKLLTVPLNVTDQASWTAAKATVESALGAVDVLVNNAGVSHQYSPIEDISDSDFALLMGVNVEGVFRGCKTFTAGMKARGSGHIVNVASLNGLLPFQTYTLYCATKFAVAGMSEALHRELAPHGVGVSILYPGLTKSRLVDNQRGSVQSMVAMDAIWVERAVCRGIEENRLHIITHPGMRRSLDRRLGVLLGDFGEPAQPGFTGK